MLRHTRDSTGGCPTVQRDIFYTLGGYPWVTCKWEPLVYWYIFAVTTKYQFLVAAEKNHLQQKFHFGDQETEIG